MSNLKPTEGLSQNHRPVRFKGVIERPVREDSMEPVLPASSVGQDFSSSQQASRNSPVSDRKSATSQRDEPVSTDLDVGLLPGDSDSDDSDGGGDTGRGNQQEGNFVSPGKSDLEPFVDDEIIKAELGGEDTSTQEAKDATDETDTKEQQSTEEDTKGAEKTKKKSRKLKKFTEVRKAFDGREVVFVTECSQTDWKWKDTVERTGKGTLMAPTSVKPESRQTVSQARTDDESLMDDRTGTDYTPFSLQPNDEFGIPMLDMSSDSDSSDSETPKKPKPQKHHLPTIGPPQILKYIRESDQIERDTDKASSDQEDEIRESANYILDENGRPAGMFSGPCEFCGDDIKLFPTLEQQLSEPPESLYCCEDYREFVEFAMSTATRLEEDMEKKNHKISIKVHGHHGSKQARKLAKEQAVQRMRERELARRQQEASGLQAAFYQSANLAPPGGQARKPGQPGGGMIFKDMDPRGKARKRKQKRLKGTKNDEDGGVGDNMGQDEDDLGAEADSDSADSEELFAILDDMKENTAAGQGGGGGTKGGGGGGSSSRKVSANKHGGSGVVPRAEPRSQLPSSGPLGPVGSMSSFTGLNPEVARQMKTINYQLSSQRCLEEGWTLRAPSPLDLDNPENEIFIPEPLHPAMIATGKLHGRPLIEKFYPDGTKFITMFPDGTGNVFYPSGRLGILISSVSLDKNTYVVHNDNEDHDILAVFEPNGSGCCYFANGKVRLCYDQLSGTELDISGARKRVWSWRDQETHVHAPPFQPIVFGMNCYLGVRFMAQDSIALTLTARKRSCRFNVGARLKLVAPECIPPKGIDEQFLFISERKVKVDMILDKVSNLLKFPKSPKLDRILPPLSVTAQQQRVNKMTQDYMASLPALGPPVGAGSAALTGGPGGTAGAGGRSSRLPRRPTRQPSRLSSSLDVPSVSVT